MFYRILLTALVISCTFTYDQIHALGDSSAKQINQIKDVICVLVMSGMEREDLDVALLKKLERYNVNVNDLKNDTVRQECNKKDKAAEQSGDKKETDITDAPKIHVAIRRRRRKDKLFTTKYAKIKTSQFETKTKVINESNKQLKTETTPENPSMDYNKDLSKPENVMKIMKLYTNLQNNIGSNVKLLVNSNSNQRFTTDLSMLTTEHSNNDDIQSFDINNSNENNFSSRNTVELLNQLIKHNKLTLSAGNKKVNLNHRLKFRKDNTVNNYLGFIKPQTSAEVTTAAPCCQVNNNIYSFNKYPDEINQGVEKFQPTHSTENSNTSKNILYEIPEKVIQEITDKVRHKILNDLQKDNSSKNITKLDTITQDYYNDSSKGKQSRINESMEHTTRDATLMTPTIEVVSIRNDVTTTKTDCSVKKSGKKANNTLNMLSDIKIAILKELRKDATSTSIIPTTSDQFSITNAFGDRLNAIPLNNLVCFVKSEILKHFNKASSNTNRETKKSDPTYTQNSLENRINDIPYDFLKNLVTDIKNEILGNLKKESLNLYIETTTNSVVKETEISSNTIHHDTLQELMSKIKREMRKETSPLSIQTMTNDKITESQSILSKIPYDVLKELVGKIEREMRKETSHLNIETSTNDEVTESRSIIDKIPYDVLQELVSKIKHEIKKETTSLNIETTTNAKNTEAEGILNKMPYDVLQELISKIKYEMWKETSNLNIETTTHDKDTGIEILLNKIPHDVLQELISKIKRDMTETTSNIKTETTTNYRDTETEGILNKIPYDVLQELTNKMKHEMRKETSSFDIDTTNAKDTETEVILNKIPSDILQALISKIKLEMKEDTLKLNIESTTNDKDTDRESILNKFPHDILQALMSKIKREMNKDISNFNTETTTNYEMEINLHKIPLDALEELVTKLKHEIMRDLGKEIPIPGTGAAVNSTLLLKIDKSKSKFPNDFMKEIVANVKSEILMTLRKEYVKTEATSIDSILTTETPENEVAKTPRDKLIDIMTNVKNEILRELKYDVMYSETTTSVPVIISTETSTKNIGSMEYDKLAETQEQKSKISQHTLQNIVNEVKNFVLKDIKEEIPKQIGEVIIRDPVNVYPNKFYKDIFQKIKISNVQKNKIVVKDRKRRTTTMTPMSTVEIDIKTTKNDLVLDKMLQVLNQLNTLKETITNKATTEKNYMLTKITTENNESIVVPPSNIEVPGRGGPSVIIKPSPYSLIPKLSNMEDNVIVQSRRDPYVKTFSLSQQPEEKRVLIAETYQTNSDSIPPLGIPMRARPNPFHSLVQNQNIVVTSKPDIQVVRYDPSMYNNQKFQLNPPSIPLVPQNFKYRPPLSHLDFEEYFANNNHIMAADGYNQKSDVFDTPQQRQSSQNKYDYTQLHQPINKEYLDPRKRNQNQYPFKFFQNQPFDQGLNIQLGYDYPQMQPDPAATIDRYQQSYRPSTYSETPRYQRPKLEQGVYRKVENKKKYLRTRDAQSETDQDRNRIGEIIDSRERDRKVNSIEKRISKVTRVPKRKQESLKKRPSTYDDAHFKNFLKTQQKVNQMLEKILSTKKAVNSVELLKKR